MTDPRLDATSLPPELVAERRRVQRLGADAEQRTERRRLRRRVLLPAAVASGVLASTGLVSAWARVTTPIAGSASQSPAAPAAPPATGTSADQAFVHKLRQTLKADQQAIAALPQMAASKLAASTASTASAAGTGAGAPPAGTGVPAATTITTLPPISVPAASAAPPTHATTGASAIP